MAFVSARRDVMDGYGFDTIRVKKEVFLPVIWSMTCFSLLFLPLRFWTRWRSFGRFFADDLFALVAWLAAAAMGGVAVYMAEAMYWTMELASANPRPGTFNPSHLPRIRIFSYGANISYMLMYTSLWSVKLSFLLFFYRLGPRLIRGVKWHWWSVAAITAVAYATTFTTYPYVCGFGSYEQIITPYCTSEQSMSFVNLKVNVGLDVGTDVLIMTIPLNILWRSRIPVKQSLALAGVFSLVLVTIVFAIVRATVSTVGVTKQMDAPWVLVWSSAEANIAIIVACLGSARMLFIQSRRDEGREPGQFGRPRRIDKTTTLEIGTSVEEMATVQEHLDWSHIGAVESTIASTNQDSVMGERDMTRYGDGRMTQSSHF